MLEYRVPEKLPLPSLVTRVTGGAELAAAMSGLQQGEEFARALARIEDLERRIAALETRQER